MTKFIRLFWISLITGAMVGCVSYRAPKDEVAGCSPVYGWDAVRNVGTIDWKCG